MRTYMRNKVSGEIRDVELDSDEFRGLQVEVTSNGLPMWEQTSYAHADAVKGRASVDDLFEEDLGSEDQENLRHAALQLDAEGVAPEVNPHLALTPGEIEAGLTPQSKLEDLREQYHQGRAEHRSGVLVGAAKRIAGDDYEGSSDADDISGDSLSARSGGSDDRDNAPSRGASATPRKSGGNAKAPASPSTSSGASGGGDS